MYAFNGFKFLLQFKESVAQFATENIAPHASNIDHTNYFPKVCIMRWYICFDFWANTQFGPRQFSRCSI